MLPIKMVKQSLRAWRIYFVFMKYGLDRAVFRLPLLKTFQFVLWFNPFYWRLKKLQLSRGERITLALESLGPIFVKFGQILSTRRDILPEDISSALSKLQDQVQPFPVDTARAIIEAALAAPIAELFLEFEPKPLASASIAQVHAARLHSGAEVIVKVLRPGIHKLVDQDLALLKRGAHWLQFWSRTLRRFNLSGMVLELERTLHNELDLIKEAANASELKRNSLRTQHKLYIPKVYWDYCRNNVLVMERIYGIPVADKAGLSVAGFNLKHVGEEGLRLFYQQVFQDSFFHADLHPGNLFIHPGHPEKPQWIMVDFGIVGTLSKENQHYLAANFLAFINRDYRRVAELHRESGWVPKNVRVDVLEAAIRSVCEPIFELPPTHISVGQTLMRLLMIAREFNMEIMPELLLLQKSLINIEGVVKFLAPDIDVWGIARPTLEQWMQQQVGLRGLWRQIKQELPVIINKLPELPGLLYQVLRTQADAPSRASVDVSVSSSSDSSKYLKWLFPLATLGIGILVGWFFK